MSKPPTIKCRQCGKSTPKQDAIEYKPKFYFCTHSKSIMKQWKEAFQWPILPYPKGDNNADYELGTREEPIIIKKDK